MMYQYSVPEVAIMFGLSVGMFVAILMVLAVWSIFWKGWALWIAARNQQKAWFVVLLIVNTLGILEIIYIFAIGKPKLKNGPQNT